MENTLQKPAISAVKTFERHSFCKGQSLRNNKISFYIGTNGMLDFFG